MIRYVYRVCIVSVHTNNSTTTLLPLKLSYILYRHSHSPFSLFSHFSCQKHLASSSVYIHSLSLIGQSVTSYPRYIYIFFFPFIFLSPLRVTNLAQFVTGGTRWNIILIVRRDRRPLLIIVSSCKIDFAKNWPSWAGGSNQSPVTTSFIRS